jgi:hypothetical protein
MITPSPTAKISPELARGTFDGLLPATATKPAYVVLGILNTSYQLHLIPTGDPASIKLAIGKRLVGTVKCQARRVDITGTGGRYLEPVVGRLQRVQGSIVAVAGDAIVVNAGIPIHATPTAPGQSAASFQVGQFVTFDVMEGATFTPQ